MKTPKNFSLFLSFILLLLVLTACKDECKKVTCVNGACVDGNCLCNDGWAGASCDERDACYQRTCVNGYCADGTCACDPYYEGNTCSIGINQKFAGNFYVRDSSIISNDVNFYSVVILPFSNSLDGIQIQNFYGDNRTIIAVVSTDRFTFSFARQFIYQWLPTTLSGESTSASLAADGLSATIHYDVYDASADTLYDRNIATLIRY
jgi:hypothetical protein